MFIPGLDKLILKVIRMRKFVAIAEKILNNKEGLLYLIPKQNKVIVDKWITMEKNARTEPYGIKVPCQMREINEERTDTGICLEKAFDPHLPLL